MKDYEWLKNLSDIVEHSSSTDIIALARTVEEATSRIRASVPVDQDEQLLEIGQTLLNAFEKTEIVKPTAMMAALLAAADRADIGGSADLIRDTMNQISIDVRDLAFVKALPLMPEGTPQAVRSVIKNVSDGTAKSLAIDEKLEFNVPKKRFVTAEGVSASLREVNGIQNGIATVNELVNNDDLLTESEMIDFMSELQENLSFAYKKPTGKKIFRLLERIWIEKNEHLVDFDHPYYYHARAYDGEMPYLKGQMLKAPEEMPNAGRYNHVGQSHFYFASTMQGAINEVRKHDNTNLSLV